MEKVKNSLAQLKCVKIPLTKGRITIIDKEDLERVSLHKWHLTTGDNKRFYAKTSLWINGKTKDIKLHRFILNLSDRFPLVDHINGDGLDNRKLNLRIATKNQNTQNSTQPNKHGFKGIYLHPDMGRKKRWVARIKTNGKIIRQHCFTKIEAAKTYDKLAKKYFGEFAKTNF